MAVLENIFSLYPIFPKQSTGRLEANPEKTWNTTFSKVFFVRSLSVMYICLAPPIPSEKGTLETINNNLPYRKGSGRISPMHLPMKKSQKVAEFFYYSRGKVHRHQKGESTTMNIY